MLIFQGVGPDQHILVKFVDVWVGGQKALLTS